METQVIINVIDGTVFVKVIEKLSKHRIDYKWFEKPPFFDSPKKLETRLQKAKKWGQEIQHIFNEFH